MKKILSLFIILGIVFISINQNSYAQKKVLRWAADTEGGAPFSFSDPSNPKQLIGFEVEIIEAIAKELNMDLEFVQNSWDSLILGLDRGTYDVAINGIEITEDRKKMVHFSDPYYLTYLQLIVHKDNQEIQSLSDCKNKKIGTLKAALAERYLQNEEGIEIVSYEEDINSFADLEHHRIDGVFLDAPIIMYYALSNKNFKKVGPPVGQMMYGIAIKKDNTKLLGEINLALKKIVQNGKFREIMDRWNLWNPYMATHFSDPNPTKIPPVMYNNFIALNGPKTDFFDKIKHYADFLPLFLQGAIVTLKVSILSMILAMLLGFILAISRLYAIKPISFLSICYIELIRGTPLLIQMLFIFYGLPYVGINLTPFIAAVLGLGLNYAAYEAENYRAGITSIHKQQWDAGEALGMNKKEILRYIVIPQAYRLVLPPITNDFISLLKDSSLVSVITMVELTKVYGKIATTYFDYFGTGVMVAMIYFLIGLPFVQLAKYFERKLKINPK